MATSQVCQARPSVNLPGTSPISNGTTHLGPPRRPPYSAISVPSARRTARLRSPASDPAWFAAVAGLPAVGHRPIQYWSTHLSFIVAVARQYCVLGADRGRALSQSPASRTSAANCKAPSLPCLQVRLQLQGRPAAGDIGGNRRRRLAERGDLRPCPCAGHGPVGKRDRARGGRRAVNLCRVAFPVPPPPGDKSGLRLIRQGEGRPGRPAWSSGSWDSGPRGAGLCGTCPAFLATRTVPRTASPTPRARARLRCTRRDRRRRTAAAARSAASLVLAHERRRSIARHPGPRRRACSSGELAAEALECVSGRSR